MTVEQLNELKELSEKFKSGNVDAEKIRLLSEMLDKMKNNNTIADKVLSDDI